MEKIIIEVPAKQALGGTLINRTYFSSVFLGLRDPLSGTRCKMSAYGVYLLCLWSIYMTPQHECVLVQIIHIWVTRSGIPISNLKIQTESGLEGEKSHIVRKLWEIRRTFLDLRVELRTDIYHAWMVMGSTSKSQSIFVHPNLLQHSVCSLAIDIQETTRCFTEAHKWVWLLSTAVVDIYRHVA